MNRAQVVMQAKAMGYTGMLTAAGRIDLDEWTPYGKEFGHRVQFTMDGSAKVHEITDPTELYSGVWTLLK